jgi:signal peptidase
MEVINEMRGTLSRMDLRTVNSFDWQYIQQIIHFGLIVASALMIWKSLMVITNSESPIVVVLRFYPSYSIIVGAWNQHFSGAISSS